MRWWDIGSSVSKPGWTATLPSLSSRESSSQPSKISCVFRWHLPLPEVNRVDQPCRQGPARRFVFRSLLSVGPAGDAFVRVFDRHDFATTFGLRPGTLPETNWGTTASLRMYVSRPGRFRLRSAVRSAANELKTEGSMSPPLAFSRRPNAP